MEPDERDVEIFERIPWESLEKRKDSRWVLYALAGAVVLGAVGVTVGRGMVSSSPPPGTVAAAAATPSSDSIALTSLPPPAPASTLPVTAAPESPTSWSEADLMAVPAATLEDTAGALAEWFVVDHFTRDGSTPGSEGLSFVEWTTVLDRKWLSPSTIEITVVVRRLAAIDGDPYRRLPAEAWSVTAELDDDGWAIVDGPVVAPTPEPSVIRAELDEAVPAEVIARVDDGDVRSGSEFAGRWLVEIEWTDEVGLAWVVRRWVDVESG